MAHSGKRVEEREYYEYSNEQETLGSGENCLLKKKQRKKRVFDVRKNEK